VADFERNNVETYDQRWINLIGMDAMSAALGDKKKAKEKELSLPREQWANIKKKTIADFKEGFKEALPNFIKLRKNKQ
jgi:hypothetical protein